MSTVIKRNYLSGCLDIPRKYVEMGSRSILKVGFGSAKEIFSHSFSSNHPLPLESLTENCFQKLRKCHAFPCLVALLTSYSLAEVGGGGSHMTPAMLIRVLPPDWSEGGDQRSLTSEIMELTESEVVQFLKPCHLVENLSCTNREWQAF